MKGSCRIVAVLVVTALLYACGKDKTHQEPNVESEIKHVSEDYVEAFNNHDNDKLSSLMTDDALYINLNTQEIIQGKDNLTNYLKKQFEEEGASIAITINSITFKNPDNAMEKGEAVISYKAKPAVRKAFYADYVKIDNVWLLDKISEINISQLSSQFDHLKELRWLVGKWIDADDDVSLELSYDWDKSKNFLIQHFTMQILNYKQIEGVQIIGWDPIKERIRSWIFDSDGGFGDGVWSAADNALYTRVFFTTADGQKASATHVYTKVDDNTYTFASENRAIDGSLLPNIGPFKVVRQSGGTR